MRQQDLVIPNRELLKGSPACYLGIFLTISVQNCSADFNFVISHLSFLVSLCFCAAGVASMHRHLAAFAVLGKCCFFYVLSHGGSE